MVIWAAGGIEIYSSNFENIAIGKVCLLSPSDQLWTQAFRDELPSLLFD